MPAMSSVSPASPGPRTPSARSDGRPGPSQSNGRVHSGEQSPMLAPLIDIADRDIGKRYRTDTANLPAGVDAVGRNRTAVLEFAVLALLHRAPMHGYELSKQLNMLLGTFRAL